MPAPAPAEAPKGTARRDQLLEMQTRVQAKWEASKAFEVDAPAGTWDGGLFSVLGTPIADDATFTVGANTFHLDYNYAGNSVVLVPEPGSAALLLGGLGMLGFRRRRA